ncbi:CocE/NonD family Hydrolase [Phlyctema vagabunda]|uniref:CocE/NonD family Hydrolase n=1 Tax=Phlyctema vagabunda TaxID=108571 RepID=A0ABR4P1L5_9HELO
MTSKYNSTEEVVWFISVTKEDDWDLARFQHEYHDVHGGMTAKMAESNPALRQYSQFTNLEFRNHEVDQPVWNCITRLTWQSLDVVWAGFQHPQYKATAGKHVFCRLDQVGALMRKVEEFQGRASPGETQVNVLIFHRRNNPDIEVSGTWLKQRAHNAHQNFAHEESLLSYRLLTDVTPKDINSFFDGTQFAKGSWARYLAVEEFVFPDRQKATSFLAAHEHFTETSIAVTSPQIVIGDEIKVV